MPWPKDRVYRDLEMDLLEKDLGIQIKNIRLMKNTDRQTLCEQAGISQNALRHLEDGRGATVKTLIHIAYVLGKIDWIKNFAPTVSINPLHMVRGKPRRRAKRRAKIEI